MVFSFFQNHFFLSSFISLSQTLVKFSSVFEFKEFVRDSKKECQKDE